MVHVERTFDVDGPQDRVLDYLADFSHAETWDPGTQSCTQLSPGAVAVGTQWKNVSKIAGATTELTYALESRSANELVLVGRNATATSTDTIHVEARAAGGSTVTYRADIALNGLAKLSAPLMKLVMERLGSKTVVGIQKAVAAL